MKAIIVSAAFAVFVLGGCSSDPTQQALGSWIFLPYEGPTEVTNVKSGDWIIRQAIVPEGAARLKVEFTHDDKIMESGAALAQANRWRNTPIYCAFSPLREKGALEKMFLVREEMHICFEDGDNDGTFDNYYVVPVAFDALPVINTVLRDPQPTSTPYQVVDPRTLETNYYAGLRYTGKPLLYNRRNFRFAYGSDANVDVLDTFVYAKGEDYPQSTSLMSSKITILAEHDEGMTIRIDQPFRPGESFSLYQHVEYRVY